MDNELLEYCLGRGILLDKEIFKLFSETEDMDSVKLIVEKLRKNISQKIITKNTLNSQKEKMSEFFTNLPLENQKNLEKLKIKLGLSIEISNEISTMNNPSVFGKKENFFVNRGSVKQPASVKIPNKKLEVSDFVKYFRNRFSEMKSLLQGYSKLDNPVSINRISGSNSGISIIGLVSSKKTTKNRNMILNIEDLTGSIKVLVDKDKKELYKKAEDIPLDSVIGFKGSGNREIFFVNDIFFPDAILPEKKNSILDESVLFVGDLHFGSKRFLKDSFLKFIDYLNGKFPNTPEVANIKYLFIVGDLVTGVGNYPNQEQDLEICDLEEQFSKLADLLSEIRNDITIIISPGNHDGVRLMEPQPSFDKKFAWALYDLENVIITDNPAQLNIGAGRNFPGFNILTYHGFSLPFYANSVSRLLIQRAMNTPEEIIKYLLMNRHLAPTHSSVQYFPSEKDELIIREVPDIIVTAHTHKSAVSYYNNILVVSTSCWEAMTPYQEKFGNTPDHCKVPMFNLRTRAVKILDFESKEE